MGTEQEAEGNKVEGVTMLVEKLGLVLARIESSPWNKGPLRYRTPPVLRARRYEQETPNG